MPETARQNQYSKPKGYIFSNLNKVHKRASETNYKQHIHITPLPPFRALNPPRIPSDGNSCATTSGQLVFAHEFGMMTEGSDPEGLWHMMDTGMHVLGTLSIIPWITPILKSIPGSDNAMKEFQHLTETYAKNRLVIGAGRKDLWYHLTGEEGERQAIEPDNVLADALTAVVGGSDTTATALSNFWYFMMRHPECCERLYEEVESNFPDREQPSDFERLAEMPYLNACINESFRLISPALSGFQRRVADDSEGAAIGPYFVPPGTNVFIHFTSLYRNPEIFSPLPDTFWPDRWLDQDTYVLPTSGSDGRKREIPKNELKLAREAFIPFSAGPQSCPAKGLAMLEMRYLAALVVQRFVIRPAEGYDLDRWEKELKDMHLTVRGPLMGMLELRKS